MQRSFSEIVAEMAALIAEHPEGDRAVVWTQKLCFHVAELLDMATAADTRQGFVLLKTCRMSLEGACGEIRRIVEDAKTT